MFHHVQVSGDERIRDVYRDVQEIVRKVIGDSTPVTNMDLNEIHVTIANDDVTPQEKLTITMDQLIKDLEEDSRGVSSFDIQLLGPYLMANGVVVMEYTTSASGFWYLRKRAENRRSERVLSEGNRASVPSIIHSTISVIRDKKMPRATRIKLQDELTKYRQELKPVTFRVQEITATNFDEASRRFIGSSRRVPLKGGVRDIIADTSEITLDSAMKEDTKDKLRRFWPRIRTAAQLITIAISGSLFYYYDLFQVRSPFIDVEKEFMQQQYYYPEDESINRVMVGDIGQKMINHNWQLETQPVLLKRAASSAGSTEFSFHFNLTNVSPIEKKIRSVSIFGYNDSALPLKSMSQSLSGESGVFKFGKSLGISLDLPVSGMLKQVAVVVVSEDGTSNVLVVSGIDKLPLPETVGLPDAAMNGGIDIKNIDVTGKNRSVPTRFNDAALRDMLDNGFNGFTPVVISVTPIVSPLPLLGLNEVTQPKLFVKEGRFGYR